MSIFRALIVDTNYIKINYSQYIDSNIDDNLLQSCIFMAQDINLQENIGYNMYQYIITGLITNNTGASFSTYYQFILNNYIQPSVSLWSIYQAYSSLLIKATNKAVVIKKSEESDSVGIKELEYMKNEIRNNAQFYDARTREYIMNNVNQFTEYFTTSGVDRIVPKSQVYYGGIYLGNGGKGRGYFNGGSRYGDDNYRTLNW